MDNGFVDVNLDSWVGTITFGHPKSNSLPGHLLRRLTAAFRQVAESKQVRVVVLRSEGTGVFCAGASLDELLSIKDEKAGNQFFAEFARLIQAMRNCPLPIIGRVQGKAVGGGVGLLSATDYCLATHAASLRMGELVLRVGPFVIAPAILRKTGLSIFTQLIMNPLQWQDATWAQRVGLYAQVVEGVEGLDLAIEKLAAELARSNPAALVELKNALWEGADPWEDQLFRGAVHSGRLVLMPHTQKALESYRSKP